MPSLRAPTATVRDSFVAASRDLRDEGWLPGFPVDEVAADFGGYVRQVSAQKLGWGVPVSTLWYVDGHAYLGTVIIRHRLTPELTRHGGHIGYHVAPRRRREGHATAMLAAAVGYCRETVGLGRILVTCDQVNTASRRVIESNGGALENVLDGECRYWIEPPEGATASDEQEQARPLLRHGQVRGRRPALHGLGRVPGAGPRPGGGGADRERAGAGLGRGPDHPAAGRRDEAGRVRRGRAAGEPLMRALRLRPLGPGDEAAFRDALAAMTRGLAA